MLETGSRVWPSRVVAVVTAYFAAGGLLIAASQSQLPERRVIRTKLIAIDVGPQPLGAYTIALRFDPRVLAIEKIEGGDAREFTSPPLQNSKSFRTGTTKISAFQISGMHSPTGVVGVARVSYTLKGAALGPNGTTPTGSSQNSHGKPPKEPGIDVSLEVAASTSGRPIANAKIVEP